MPYLLARRGIHRVKVTICGTKVGCIISNERRSRDLFPLCLEGPDQPSRAGIEFVEPSCSIAHVHTQGSYMLARGAGCMTGTMTYQIHNHNQASNQECEKQESNNSIETTAQCLSFRGFRKITLHNDSAFLIESKIIMVIVIFLNKAF